MLFPKYFTDRNEPAHLGWVLMALSVGGLIGALSYAVLSKYMKKRTTMLVAVLTLGVAMTVIAFLPPLPLILALCVVVGLVYGPIAPIYNYVMQTRAPAAPARPGGRGDGFAGLRRRPARPDPGRAAGRRRRAADHLPGAVGADAGRRVDRGGAAVAARPRSNARSVGSRPCPRQ